MGLFWFQRGLALLPVLLVIWTYLTFTISYIFAVSRGDVDPGFPYISDTGARRPESSLFGQMLNISAVIALACLYVRYKQVAGYVDMLEVEKTRRVFWTNRVSFAFSLLICFGLSLVANFQETSVLGVHMAGAALTFGFGTVYEFMQTYVSYKMHPEVNGRPVCHARLVISVISAAALLGTFLSAAFMSVLDEHGHIKFHWKPEEKGYSAHLASTIMEWILAGSFLTYFFTFIRDFQVISIRFEACLHHTTLYHVGGDQLREEEEDGRVQMQ